MSGVADLRGVFPEKEWFEALRAAVARDPELAVIGRWCDLDLALAIDGELVLLRIRAGKIAETVFTPDLGASWTVTLRGTLEDWRAFLQPMPPPFYSDLLAMNSRVSSFSIEGDRRTFVRHLRSIGRVFALAQRIGDKRA
ncbi:MAG TPA: hypothetical protein VFJ72_01050 [Rubrobacteraceae bacterium]|nr:hypothetical protein [Rubrobacteraceae bacterium]